MSSNPFDEDANKTSNPFEEDNDQLNVDDDARSSSQKSVNGKNLFDFF